jgi:hypothetical protein
MKNSRQAVVLIVVLGVLALLVIIGTLFSMIASLERVSARSYVDYVQAKLHAQSGIHHALSSIRELVKEKDGLDKLAYYGEDLNCNGKMDLPEENQDNDKILQIHDCPLSRAVRPSLMMDLNGDGKISEEDLIVVRGRKVGVSGVVPSQYREGDSYFALKIEDLASRIYVNMEDHEHLQKILENLADTVGLDREVGERIYKNKPYYSLEEIKTKAELNTKEFNRIENHITVVGWCDKNVVNPVPLKNRVGNLKIGDTIDGWRELRPIKIDFPRNAKGEIVGRAPVNINTASKEVIIALIRDLKGFYLREPADKFSRMFTTTPQSGFALLANTDFQKAPYYAGYVKIGRVLETTPFSAVSATAIANKIISYRTLSDTFRSWHQFNLFVENELFGLIPNQQQRDVLKGNFNPNTNLNDFNPDYNRLLWVDKTDLTYYTTEFCFYPTGYYNISSLGRVLSQDNKVLGESEVKTTLKIFEIYRETNQAQFSEGTTSRKTAWGPTYRKYRQMQSLQVMPELPAYERDTNYDGYITLATTENSNSGGQFRAYFYGPDADSGEPILSDTAGPFKDRLLPLTAGNRIGNLFQDGIYSEKDSIPAYTYRPSEVICSNPVRHPTCCWRRRTCSNPSQHPVCCNPANRTIPFQRLMVSMWVKPHFRPEDTQRTRWFISWNGPPPNATATQRRRTPSYFGIWNVANARVDTEPSQSRSSFINRLSATTKYRNYATPAENNAWDDLSIIAGGLAGDGTIVTRNRIYISGTPFLNKLGNRRYYPGPPPPPPRWERKQVKEGERLAWRWVRIQDTATPYPEPAEGRYLPAVPSVPGGAVAGGWTPGTAFLEAGCWIHIGWEFKLPMPGNWEQYNRLYINGRPSSPPQVYNNATLDTAVFHSGLADNLRLGERSSRIDYGSSGRLRYPHPVDSTIDEVLIGPSLGRGLNNIWLDGRYYMGNNRYDDKRNDRVFTSRQIDLRKESNAPSGTDITIFLVQWTVYPAKTLEPNIVYPDGLSGNINVQITNGAIMTDTRGAMPGTGGGSLTLSEPFRYKLYFNLKVDLNKVVTDTPIFDDITLYYYTEPKILSWAYVK